MHGAVAGVLAVVVELVGVDRRRDTVGNHKSHQGLAGGRVLQNPDAVWAAVKDLVAGECRESSGEISGLHGVGFRFFLFGSAASECDGDGDCAGDKNAQRACHVYSPSQQERINAFRLSFARATIGPHVSALYVPADT